MKPLPSLAMPLLSNSVSESSINDITPGRANKMVLVGDLQGITRDIRGWKGAKNCKIGVTSFMNNSFALFDGPRLHYEILLASCPIV